MIILLSGYYNLLQKNKKYIIKKQENIKIHKYILKKKIYIYTYLYIYIYINIYIYLYLLYIYIYIIYYILDISVIKEGMGGQAWRCDIYI